MFVVSPPARTCRTKHRFAHHLQVVAQPLRFDLGVGRCTLASHRSWLRVGDGTPILCTTVAAVNRHARPLQCSRHDPTRYGFRALP